MVEDGLVASWKCYERTGALNATHSKASGFVKMRMCRRQFDELMAATEPDDHAAKEAGLREALAKIPLQARVRSFDTSRRVAATRHSQDPAARKHSERRVASVRVAPAATE